MAAPQDTVRVHLARGDYKKYDFWYPEAPKEPYKGVYRIKSIEEDKANPNNTIAHVKFQKGDSQRLYLVKIANHQEATQQQIEEANKSHPKSLLQKLFG